MIKHVQVALSLMLFIFFFKTSVSLVYILPKKMQYLIEHVHVIRLLYIKSLSFYTLKGDNATEM